MRKLLIAGIAAAFGAFAFASAPAQARDRDAEVMMGIIGGVIQDRIERSERKRWCKRNPWECRRGYRGHYDDPRPYRPYPNDCVYDRYGNRFCR